VDATQAFHAHTWFNQSGGRRGDRAKALEFEVRLQGPAHGAPVDLNRATLRCQLLYARASAPQAAPLDHVFDDALTVIARTRALGFHLGRTKLKPQCDEYI
jgi:hypothetical protein